MNVWRFAGVRFSLRHLWLGAWMNADGDRLIVCLLPTLPIVFVREEVAL